MDLDEFNLDIKIEVTSIEELREVRKELQKIAKSKKEIEVVEDDEDYDPLDAIDIPKPDRDPDPFYPDYPKKDFPHFISDTKQESGFETGFEVTLECLEDDVDEFGVDEDEAFSKIGQMDQEMFNDRSMR